MPRNVELLVDEGGRRLPAEKDEAFALATSLDALLTDTAQEWESRSREFTTGVTGSRWSGRMQRPQTQPWSSCRRERVSSLYAR